MWCCQRFLNNWPTIAQHNLGKLNARLKAKLRYLQWRPSDRRGPLSIPLLTNAMSEAITAAVSDRICKHMNKDHSDAVLVYAQRFGGLSEATAATMAAIDPEGMDLVAQVEGSEQPVRVKFEHPLADAADAHHTLVAMLRSK